MTQATTTITMDDGEVGDDLRLKMGPVQLLDDFSAGVNPSGSLPVADFNLVRKNAAPSDHNFFGRGTAHSHGTNVTSVKPRRAPNSFPHSESNQIKNAINFSVWRKFIQFQEANGASGGMGDFDFGRHAGSTCKTPGCQNICGPLHLNP